METTQRLAEIPVRSIYGAEKYNSVVEVLEYRKENFAEVLKGLDIEGEVTVIVVDLISFTTK